MAQSKQELEEWYKNPDPWGYETNPDDQKRKDTIISLLGEYEKALDIGAGEGWITKDLPAKQKYAYEIADNAKKRLPESVSSVDEPMGEYDLIIATGVLYKHYDCQKMIDLINKHASRHVLIAGIKDWLVDFDIGEIVEERFMQYRDYIQRITLYEITP